jgi:DNA primase
LVFDSDSAGVKATDRALEIAIEKGFDIYILQLPKGEDPDSFVKNHGGELFNIYLDGSVSFLEFKINKLKEEGKLKNPQSKAEAARDIVRIISKIPDRLQHDDYIANLARYMNFSEFQLQQIYKEKNEIEKKDKKQKKRENVEHQKDSAVPVQEIDTNLKNKLQKEEYILLETCLAETDGIKTLFSNENFNMNLIISSEGKRLFTILENLYSITDNVVDELMADESISERKIY